MLYLAQSHYCPTALKPLLHSSKDTCISCRPQRNSSHVSTSRTTRKPQKQSPRPHCPSAQRMRNDLSESSTGPSFLGSCSSTFSPISTEVTWVTPAILASKRISASPASSIRLLRLLSTLAPSYSVRSVL